MTMETMGQLKQLIERGTRVLVSSSFFDLHEELQKKEVMLIEDLPVSNRVVEQISHCGWGLFTDVLFVLANELPVVGYVGMIVVCGGNERQLEQGWADYNVQSIDMGLWFEGLSDGQLRRTNWQQQVSLKSSESFVGSFERPILFLDRDNVIIHDVPYNSNHENVVLMDGISALIRRAHQIGWWVAMVSNQSGLGREKIRFDEYGYVHRQVLNLLAQEHAWIDESQWASYIEGSHVVEGRQEASMRKPRPGMIWKTQRKLKGNLAASHMVGDSASDLLAAEQAGVGNLWLLKSDKVQNEIEKLQRLRGDLKYHVIEKLSELRL
jgi:histidinol-phosphate phosphatase family protein